MHRVVSRRWRRRRACVLLALANSTTRLLTGDSSGRLVASADNDLKNRWSEYTQPAMPGGCIPSEPSSHERAVSRFASWMCARNEAWPRSSHSTDSVLSFFSAKDKPSSHGGSHFSKRPAGLKLAWRNLFVACFFLRFLRAGSSAWRSQSPTPSTPGTPEDPAACVLLLCGGLDMMLVEPRSIGQ